MAKEEDKIELRLDSEKAGDIPAKSDKPKSPKKKSVNFKKFALIILVALIVVAVVAGVVYMNNPSDEGDEVVQEPTYAEELENFPVIEGADQEVVNSNSLALATAFYNEQNYSRTLELLDSIINPSEIILNSQVRLYADSYDALGEYEKAKPYYAQALEINKVSLTKLSVSDPGGDYELAYLYEKIGDTQKAIEHYNKVLEVTGINPEEQDDYYSALITNSQAALDRLQS